MPSPITPVTQQKQYRAVVLKDLIDSEKAHVAELQGLVKTFLKPLEKSTMYVALLHFVKKYNYCI